MSPENKLRKGLINLERVEEVPHFDKVAFKINQKIFATLNLKEKRACVKLTEMDQDAFCLYRKDVMYPVPNKWGKQGWTNINLMTIPEEMLEEALKTAYETVKSGKRKK